MAFVNVKKAKVLCPICRNEGRGGNSWCLVSEDRQLVICPRVSDGAIKNLGEAGYLHAHPDAEPTDEYRPRRPVMRRPVKPVLDFTPLAREYVEAANIGFVMVVASQLGVTPHSLQRLRMGRYDHERDTATFPMRDHNRKVIGIRVRASDGQKWAVTGSRNALFIPVGLTGRGPLLIAEGPTDTAALMDLGFDVIGRPSCTGGVDFLVDLPFVKRRDVVIVADNDGPGLDGAMKLADKMPRGRTKVINPGGCSDSRDWKRNGVTYSLVEARIEAAVFVR